MCVCCEMCGISGATRESQVSLSEFGGVEREYSGGAHCMEYVGLKVSGNRLEAGGTDCVKVL